MVKLSTIIFLLMISINSYAKDVITIYWGWSSGDSLANITRALVDEANQIQNEYIFVFDVKPGAGGAVAANFVKRKPNTILATSSAFFIRPNLYSTSTNYRINEFKELMPQCYSPIIMTSSKYQSWQQISKDQPLFIGVSGMGSTTHLTSTQLQSTYKNLTSVPYKGPSESLVAMISGDIDIDAGFLGSIEAWKESNQTQKISVLGITGSSRDFGYQLMIDQGFPDLFASITLSLHLVIPITTPDEKSKAWREILVKASESTTVRNAYKFNYCIPLHNIPTKDMQPWFESQTAHWKKMSGSINLEK